MAHAIQITVAPRRASGTGAVLVSGPRLRRTAAPAGVRHLGGSADRLRDRPVRSRSCVRDRRSGRRRPAGVLLKVPEGKTAKNRMHLDVHVEPSELHAHAAELVELGATYVAEFDYPEVTGSHARPRGQRVLPPMTPRSDGGSEGRTVGHDRPR